MHVLNLEELRNRGFSDTTIFPDEVLIDAEEKIWDIIQLFTKRYFKLFSATLKLDGSGDSEQYIPYNIVSISSVEETDYGEISLDEIVVYNRQKPSDFNFPRIAWINGSFPIGYQNIWVTGVFGDVNVDGLPFGPLLEAAKRMMYLVFEPLLGSGESIYSSGSSGPSPSLIKSERTDKYEYVKFDKQLTSGLVDDPFTNAILLQYRLCDDVVTGGFV